jgi:hypothetical protein
MLLNISARPWSRLSSGSPPPRPAQENSSRRHTVPQPIEVVLQPHLELLDRHAVGPAAPPSLFTFSHAAQISCLGMSCDLPCNLAHSYDSSLPVDRISQPEQPPHLRSQPTAIRRRITATTGESASVPASVLCSSRIPPLGALPLAHYYPSNCIGGRDSAAWVQANPGL